MASPATSDRQDGLRDQSTADLVRHLAEETKTLVTQELELVRADVTRVGEGVLTLARQELQLAKAEMSEKGKKAGAGAGLMGLSGGIALLAGAAFTAFLILGLDGVMPNWLAALVVAGAYGLVAALIFSAGKGRVQEAGPFVPEQTIDSVKEDVKWAKTQVRSENS
jgi:Putative Actinobacterial Holin-X, holin superfamily III